MRWAISTRWGWGLFICAALLGLWAAGAHAVDLPLPIPGLSTVAPVIPLPVIPALAMTVLAIWCGQRGERPWMQASVNDPQLLSLGLSIAALALSSLTAWGVAFLAGTNSLDALLYARNVFAFYFLAIFAQYLGAGAYAAGIPILLLLVTGLFARNAAGGLRWWAWIVGRDPLDPVGLACIGICVLGVAFRLRQGL